MLAAQDVANFLVYIGIAWIGDELVLCQQHHESRHLASRAGEIRDSALLGFGPPRRKSYAGCVFRKPVRPGVTARHPQAPGWGRWGPRRCRIKERGALQHSVDV